jgi:hypothetical protein
MAPRQREVERVHAYLLWRDWLLASLVKLLNGLLVVTEILLATNKDDWETRAEVHNLRDPLIAKH